MTDARKLLVTRGIRALADGVVSVALATYLTTLGFSPFEVGATVTGTLLGSPAVTLAVGLVGYRLSRRSILLGATAMMVVTRIGFAGRHEATAIDLATPPSCRGGHANP